MFKLASVAPLLLLAGSTMACDSILGGVEWMHVQPFDSTYVLASPDFNADGRHPVETPAPEQQSGLLFYQASLTIVDTTLGSGPMSVWVRVRIRNPSNDTVAVPVPGCAVWPEVFSSPARTGTAEWIPGGRIPGDECVEDPSVVAVAPSAPAELTFLVYDAMLARGLEVDGRYYFTANLRGPEGLMRLDAGSADVRFQVPGLAYQVQLRQESLDSLRADVIVINRNGQTVHLLFGGCAMNVVLYRDEARTERVPAGNAGRFCDDYLRTVDLEAGASFQAEDFRRSLWIGDVGSGLSTGQYFVVISLDLNWHTLEFAAGWIEMW